jgi:hypothetical protein
MRITGLNSQQAAAAAGGTRTKKPSYENPAASRRLRLLIPIPYTHPSSLRSLLLEVSYQLGTYSLLHHATLPKA